MFINLSNHPSSKWSEEQTEAALQFGDIVDLPFPQVDPNGDETYIARLANEYCQKVTNLAACKPVAVHLMGEMTLTFALAKLLKAIGVPCMAATTERVVVENEPGVKTAIFRFVRFRKYE